MKLEPAYALFSGGKDSFAVAKQLQLHGMLLGCVAIDTTISVPEWRSNIETLCTKHGFPLQVIRTPFSFERFVRTYGFPGPAIHSYAMNRLKGRAIRVLRKQSPGIILASGVRKHESQRRFRNVKGGESVFEGLRVIAPLYDWTDDQVWAFVREHGYERPDVYSRLQISGDCLCGAFAREGEDEALRFWYPEMAQYLDDLRCLVPAEKPCQWGWGCKSKRKAKRGGERVICVECGDNKL